jgi:hypothetical protein
MKPCLFTYEVSQIAAWTALVVLAEVRHAPRYAQGSKTTCTLKIQPVFVQDWCFGSALVLMRIRVRHFSTNEDPDLRKAI